MDGIQVVHELCHFGIQVTVGIGIPFFSKRLQLRQHGTDAFSGCLNCIQDGIALCLSCFLHLCQGICYGITGCLQLIGQAGKGLVQRFKAGGVGVIHICQGGCNAVVA